MNDRRVYWIMAGFWFAAVLLIGGLTGFNQLPWQMRFGAVIPCIQLGMALALALKSSRR